jgi:hypothetical protein
MNMTPAERRRYWAKHIKGCKAIAYEWKHSAQDYPNDPAWAVKCRREYTHILDTAKAYLRLAQEFPK